MIEPQDFIRKAKELFVSGMTQGEAAIELGRNWNIKDDFGRSLMARGCMAYLGELAGLDRRGVENSPGLRAPRRGTRSGVTSHTGRLSVVAMRTKFEVLSRVGVLDITFGDVRVQAELYWAQSIGWQRKARVFDQICIAAQEHGLSDDHLVNELPDYELNALEALAGVEWKPGV